MPTSPFINLVLLVVLVIRFAVFGFKGPAGLGALLVLFPFYLFLIPVSDSLFTKSGVRSWNKFKGRFDWIEKDRHPVQFWLVVLLSWPAAAMFGYLFFAA